MWSPPWIWEIACPSTGPSTAIPSRTPPVEPGRFTIRVRPATPATPRERIAAGTPAAAPAARSASAILYRAVAGVAGRTLIVNLPGSTGGVRDGMAVLAPVLGHAISQINGGDHARSGSGAPGASGIA